MKPKNFKSNITKVCQIFAKIYLKIYVRHFLKNLIFEILKSWNWTNLHEKVTVLLKTGAFILFTFGFFSSLGYHSRLEGRVLLGFGAEPLGQDPLGQGPKGAFTVCGLSPVCALKTFCINKTIQIYGLSRADISSLGYVINCTVYL